MVRNNACLVLERLYRNTNQSIFLNRILLVVIYQVAIGIPTTINLLQEHLMGWSKIWNANSGIATNTLQANTMPDLGPFARWLSM